jgi:hypothetical protein
MSRFGKMLPMLAAANHDIYFYHVCPSPIHYSTCWIYDTGASNGTGFIHKSKLNTNGTFSVGKTWKLAELRAIQVIDASVGTYTSSSAHNHFFS